MTDSEHTPATARVAFWRDHLDAGQEVAGEPPDAPVVRLLQEVQRLEFRSFLRCLLPEDDAREVAAA